jgi:integrase/recombinase XerD
LLKRYLYGQDASVLYQYHGSSAREHLDRFARFLVRREIGRETGRLYVRIVCHLTNWMTARRMPLEDLNEETLERFVGHLRKCRCPPPRSAGGSAAMSGGRHFLRYLRGAGVAAKPPLLDFIDAPKIIASYRDGPLGSYIDGFAGFLHREHYTQESGTAYLNSARHLGQWMEAKRIRVKDLDETVIQQFDRHLSQCRCRQRPRTRSLIGARHFLRHLRDIGVARPPREPALPALLVEFSDWLKIHRGIGGETLAIYQRYIRRFLRFVGDQPSRYEPRLIRKFVLDAPQARKSVMGAVRMFLRFLEATGRCKSELHRVVPGLAQWRLSSLPRYLPPNDLDKIVGTAPPGSRDRAVLLLLARLGLRRADVVDLALSDLDWDKGTIRVVGKSRREAYLPLPQEVGEAILAYIRTQRPKADSDKVFFLTAAPVQPITRDTVSGIVYWAILRAGIKAPNRGCHLLRHSAATRWLREGLAMKDIATLLRHQSIETTGVYAKVDVGALREIAQPWPGRP